MNNLLQFAGEHPFLTWCLAWSIWPVCSMVGKILSAPFFYPYLAYKRHLRSADIRARGWPTAPLMDADGDIVHPPKDDSK
ncbi:MAG TPA: hypothetical protein VFY63_06320 [Pseudorhizobium sp.]|nr:hypothetical protein [Pseudorhizobium sp.]